MRVYQAERLTHKTILTCKMGNLRFSDLFWSILKTKTVLTIHYGPRGQHSLKWHLLASAQVDGKCQKCCTPPGHQQPFWEYMSMPVRSLQDHKFIGPTSTILFILVFTVHCKPKGALRPQPHPQHCLTFTFFFFCPSLGIQNDKVLLTDNNVSN